MRRALAVVCLGVLCLFLANCGQSYDLQSITMTPASPNIEGIGNSQAFIVTAHYSNGKTNIVTAKSLYALTPSPDPDAPVTSVSLDASGGIKVVDVACTWHATPVGTGFSYTTDPYIVTATFTDNGITKSDQAFVSVANSGTCYDGQTYKAPAGFAGN